MKKFKSDYPKLIALILGIILVIIGIIFMIRSQNYNYNGGVSRSTTSIVIGTDFYTTEEYIGLTTNAVCDLYTMVTMGIGIFFVFLGGTDICIISSRLKK